MLIVDRVEAGWSAASQYEDIREGRSRYVVAECLGMSIVMLSIGAQEYRGESPDEEYVIIHGCALQLLRCRRSWIYLRRDRSHVVTPGQTETVGLTKEMMSNVLEDEAGLRIIHAES